MIMPTSAKKSGFSGPSSTKKSTSRSKSCSSITKNSTGKRRVLGELPCDPHQKPERTHRRTKSAKKALEFNKEEQCGIEFEKDETALKSILSGSGIQPQVCHNASIRQTFAGSSCKGKQTSTTPGRMSMYYEPSKSDRMSIFDKWTAYKSRHLSKTDSSESTVPETTETQSDKDAAEEFEKDTSALKSILSEAGLQPVSDRKTRARQTFAGIASEFKQSGIPVPRNSAVRQTITGSPSKKSQNVANNKNTAVRNSLADAKVKQNTTPTKSMALRKLAVGSKVTLNGTPTAPNSAARLASIGSATRGNPNTTPMSHQNSVSRQKCETSVNKQDITPARRVVCPALAPSPAPQRQETPSASTQKHRKGVTWADELNSPRRIIKKEKLSKVLFFSIEEDSAADVEDNKENQQPDDDDRRRLQQQQKLAGKVVRKNVNIKSADNRESTLSSRNNCEISYNNDVTICYNDTTDGNESSSLSEEEEKQQYQEPCAESTNANIDKDDDVNGTSSYSPSFTPISNNTTLHRLLSMSHASHSNTTITSTTNAVVRSLDSAVGSTINDRHTQLIESATLSNGVKQAKEALGQTCVNNHDQSLNNNNNLTDESAFHVTHLDLQNKNLFPFTGSDQLYMGNGKFYTSFQNATVAKNSEEKQPGHHGTRMSATSSSLHWNRPNISPKDNLESNHNKERAHSEENHAGAKAGVSSSRDVTHTIGRNYYKDKDVETFKEGPDSELYPREITLTKTMAMHTEEVEDEQPDSSKSKTETSTRNVETVDKFVGRVKRNKKRQSITELNETLNESQIHFQNLQSEFSTLLESQNSECVSENVDNNGNQSMSASQGHMSASQGHMSASQGHMSASTSLKNANIMLQLSLIQKQQEQLQILQRQLQEQLQSELKHNPSVKSEDTQQQGTLGKSLCQENANTQKQFVENTVTTSSQQRIGSSVEGGNRRDDEREKSEIRENLEEEECNNNGSTAVNLNSVKKEITSDSSISVIQALDLSSIVQTKEKSTGSVERSVSTPPSKISHVTLVHEPLDLTPVVPSRSQNISGLSSSVITMFSPTLTQSRNGTPAKLHRIPLIDMSSVTSKQQASSLQMTPVTTVQSNMGPLVSPKVIKLEPNSKSKLSANILVSRSTVPPIWTPLALKVAADVVEESESVSHSRPMAISSDKVEEHSSIVSSIPSNENVVLDLSGSVTVTNVISSGTNISVEGDWTRFQSPAQTSNQSAFRTISGSTVMTQSGSLSLRANITPLDLSPRKQKEKPAPLRKIVLLVTSERYQEALLDDECALYAYRLQSFTRLPATRDLINPVARMLSEGDEMHFIPITDDVTYRHCYGFREGSAFHSYSP